MGNDSKKARLLWEMIKLSSDFYDLKREVLKMPYDAETPLVELKADHVINVLKRSLNINNPCMVVDWTNFFEVRDDVRISDEADGLVVEAVFQLANPELNDKELHDLVKFWLSKLTEATDPASISPDA